ncbi:hypothetical protein [uncultured Rhodoblastus sp.]|uniref:hypothetical protein n=1 Tax=uncultured Rhodoblastus sp. TaxID=543037 RepID=UPI0025D57C5E|nr:hypothetical protein [uncultured Rhodoblastus sp.]
MNDREQEIPSDPLVCYSRGLLARDKAIRLLGFRDYPEFLVALGDADHLPMPSSPPDKITEQLELFVKLWNETP